MSCRSARVEEASLGARTARGLRAVLLGLLAVSGVAVAGAAELAVGPDEYVVFHHHDALGSPVATTDADGEALWYEYTEPFGRSSGRRNGSNDRLDEDPLGLVEEGGYTRQAYTGHVRDGASGLVYMQARHYDPELGRFLSIDPVGFVASNPMSFNRYAYANNNPYRYTDPDGRNPALILLTPPGQAAVAASVNAVGFVATAAAGFFANQIAKRLQDRIFGDLTALSESAEGSNEDTTKETKTRETPGADGGVSEQTIERDANGNPVSRTHTVTVDGEVVHQHQNQVGSAGGERQFPSEWTGVEHVNAPYEDYPPSEGRPKEERNGR